MPTNSWSWRSRPMISPWSISETVPTKGGRDNSKKTSCEPWLRRRWLSKRSRLPWLMRRLLSMRRWLSMRSRLPWLRRRGLSKCSRLLRRSGFSTRSRLLWLRRSGLSRRSRLPWLRRRGLSTRSSSPCCRRWAPQLPTATLARPRARPAPIRVRFRVARICRAASSRPVALLSSTPVRPRLELPRTPVRRGRRCTHICRAASVRQAPCLTHILPRANLGRCPSICRVASWRQAGPVDLPLPAHTPRCRPGTLPRCRTALAGSCRRAGLRRFILACRRSTVVSRRSLCHRLVWRRSSCNPWAPIPARTLHHTLQRRIRPWLMACL
mmetsp:Transcript_11927/g.42668  ORF Transcript_11927/g.42668 Transcript_11927/m.42668 type:complete len:325 (+) Transcript_11927:514-1488(+)